MKIVGYDALVNALIARRHQLGWSQLELDERAGLQSGYTGKLEAWRGPQGKVAGVTSLPRWLQALGLAFVPVVTVAGSVDEQARALAARKWPPLKPWKRPQRKKRKPTAAPGATL